MLDRPRHLGQEQPAHRPDRLGPVPRGDGGHRPIDRSRLVQHADHHRSRPQRIGRDRGADQRDPLILGAVAQEVPAPGLRDRRRRVDRRLRGEGDQERQPLDRDQGHALPAPPIHEVGWRLRVNDQLQHDLDHRGDGEHGADRDHDWQDPERGLQPGCEAATLGQDRPGQGDGHDRRRDQRGATHARPDHPRDKRDRDRGSNRDQELSDQLPARGGDQQLHGDAEEQRHRAGDEREEGWVALQLREEPEGGGGQQSGHAGRGQPDRSPGQPRPIDRWADGGSHEVVEPGRQVAEEGKQAVNGMLPSGCCDCHRGWAVGRFTLHRTTSPPRSTSHGAALRSTRSETGRSCRAPSCRRWGLTRCARRATPTAASRTAGTGGA